MTGVLHIGIDGGGTRTQALLVDEGGHLVAHSAGGACNPNRMPEEGLRNTFSELLGRLWAGCPDGANRVGVLAAGIAGLSTSGNPARIEGALRGILPPSVRLTLCSDTVTALWSGSMGQPGIVLIAGTGSTAYGEDGHGNRHRAGGWGYRVGDDGSGYAVGRDAIRAVCRAFDGSAPPTRLWDLIAERHKVRTSTELTALLYSRAPVWFDTLVPLVCEAYAAGDAVAKAVVQGAVEAQTDLVLTVHRRLDFGNTAWRLVFRGGLLGKDRLFLPLLKARLSGQLTNTGQTYDEDFAPPVFGAALLALREAGVLSPHTQALLVNDLRHAGLM